MSVTGLRAPATAGLERAIAQHLMRGHEEW